MQTSEVLIALAAAASTALAVSLAHSVHFSAKANSEGLMVYYAKALIEAEGSKLMNSPEDTLQVETVLLFPYPVTVSGGAVKVGDRREEILIPFSGSASGFKIVLSYPPLRVRDG